MKRSRFINLSRMRKVTTNDAGASSEVSFAPVSTAVLKPLAVGIAAASLVACSDTQEAVVYKDVNQCIQMNPDEVAACEVAYKQAVDTAQKSGPKYRTLEDCYAEFGPNNCVPYNAGGGQSWFMPAMAGFLLGQALGGRSGYHGAPLYTSYSRYSPAYGRWSSVDGHLYGTRSYGRKLKVDGSTFKPKPKVNRTISRGGFGSTISAKSRWGGSSSRGGWGG